VLPWSLAQIAQGSIIDIFLMENRHVKRVVNPSLVSNGGTMTGWPAYLEVPMRTIKNRTLTYSLLTVVGLSLALGGCADDDSSPDFGGDGDGDGDTTGDGDGDGDGAGDGDGDGDGDGTGDGDGDGDGVPDFTNNMLASPMPPGALDPQDAPQIIVFGWDDCMFTGDHASDTTHAPDSGMNFIAQTFGPMSNPDGSDAHVSFYENGAYLPNGEEGGPWGSETDLTLAAGQELLALGFELGNHTFDHLEINGTWGGIPEAWNEGSLGGWTDLVGTMMDQQSWKDSAIGFNDQFLRDSYGVEQIYGFRAPRLEINDQGLQALSDSGYQYDVNMEEGHQWGYVSAAVQPGADSSGFNWVVWPHTLDNGSPGVWQSQDFGEKDYLVDYPQGLWEAPVYMVYVPDNGLQESIADRMKAEITSEDTSWIGDKIREMTAFDFNTFLYARLTKDEWVEIMKYNFLLRYNGNRAPITFGAHPAEFSWRYDNEVVLLQPGNEDFHDVLNYNTYQDRKDAVTEFVTWVKDNYGDDTYFMSSKELIDYMQDPFDKEGNPVAGDTLASPTCNDFFDLAGSWSVEADELGSSATVSVIDGNSMDVEFTVGANNEGAGEYAFVDVATYFDEGALSGISHIDLVYESEAPIRVRLLPAAGSGLTSKQVLLAGVGGERNARMRIKDFRPDPYATPDDILAADFVDESYLAQVVGLSFESASTVDQTSFELNIRQIIVHGLDGGSFSTRAQGLDLPTREPEARERPVDPTGSAAYWPGHPEI
jgi:hypothetical protein